MARIFILNAMKRLLLIIFALVLVTDVFAQVDRNGALKAKLDEYCKAIESESIDVQCAETDFMIASCEDIAVRNYVATLLYNHYFTSRLMGAENVAIHIYDIWFADGSLHFDDDYEASRAEMFAEFNRASLIGNRAPELVLDTFEGGKVAIPSPGRYNVIYFYDVECPKCSIESVMLHTVLEENDWPVDVFPVYVGDRMDQWRGYVGRQFTLDTQRTAVTNLRDADRTMEFQKKYGVTQTPRMFLVDPDGVIVGRGLTSTALQTMLDALFAHPSLVYGEGESMDFYDSVFAPLAVDGHQVSAEDVLSVSRHIAARTLDESGDTTLFRQMTGDLLYYLAMARGEGYKAGELAFIEEQIEARPEIWNSLEDSLTVVDLALVQKSLLEKAAAGRTVPDVDVQGCLFRHRDVRKRRTPALKSYRLSRLRRPSYVFFHLEMCSECREQSQKIDSLLAADKKFPQVLKVTCDSADIQDELLDSFDLSLFPYCIYLDRKGTVLRRYILF